MLVLSRKLDERFMIGEDIQVTVTRIERGKVRIGIDAPRDMKILRGELQAELRRLEEDAEDAEDASQ